MSSAPHIRTGGMRHRAELQSKSKATDAGGGHDAVWKTDRKIWCQIRPLSGTQRLENMRRNSPISHEIYARDEDGDVTTDKRIVYNGKAYNLLYVFSPEERGEFLHIAAEQGGVAT